MQQKILLGYSENVISLLLETLLNRGEKGPVHVFLNQPLSGQRVKSFTPPGVEVVVHSAGEAPVVGENSRFLLAVYNPEVKQKVFAYFLDRCGINEKHYSTLIHLSSVMASTASMGNGCYVEPLSVISPFSQLGFAVSVNRGVSIGHHTRIGDFVTIGPGVNIAGNTVIGDNSLIGMGSVIFDNISIGKNCKIGGGSVVTKDIPDNVVAFGNPCRITKNNPVHEQQ